MFNKRGEAKLGNFIMRKKNTFLHNFYEQSFYYTAEIFLEAQNNNIINNKTFCFEVLGILMWSSGRL